MRITVLHSGPLRVEGDFALVDAEGNPFDLAGRARVQLCRCGQSSDKPFCDESHLRCGFREDGRARDLPGPAPSHGPTDPLSHRSTCLITVNANGAYRAEGDFQVIDEDGRSYGLGARRSIALCRCGASKDKPFCDGTHNTVGFKDVTGRQESR